MGSGASSRPGRHPWRSSSWASAWDVRIGGVATLAGFALVTGLAARLGPVPFGVHDWLAFTALVSGVYMLAAIVNFALVAVYMRMLRGRSFSMNIALDLCASRCVNTPARPRARHGTRLRLRAHRLGGHRVRRRARRDLQPPAARPSLETERLRDEATERNEELAATNERLRRAPFGAMRSLVRSIHLRDKMTARHSAAVARYAREHRARDRLHRGASRNWSTPPACCTTSASSSSPTAILFADRKLTDDDWEMVKLHPEQGAKLVAP